MSTRNYSKLSRTEKKIYNDFCCGLENFRYIFKFGSTPTDTVSKVYDAVLEDNPRFFWLSGSGSFSWKSVGNNIKDMTFEAKLTEGISPTAVRVMSARLNATVKAIADRAKQYKNHFDRVLFVHDYIVDTTDYVMHAPLRSTAYGCLINHRAVCAGYAKAFQMIMNELGYECGYVRGSDRDKTSVHSSHAWNYIKIERDYYFVDVTWDDPVAEAGRHVYNNKTHNYFCISDHDLSLTHIIDKKSDCPSCKGTKYNYYVYNGFYLKKYSFSDVREIAVRQLCRGGKFTVKFATKRAADQALKDLVTNGKVYSIPGVARRISYSKSSSGLIITIKNA